MQRNDEHCNDQQTEEMGLAGNMGGCGEEGGEEEGGGGGRTPSLNIVNHISVRQNIV